MVGRVQAVVIDAWAVVRHGLRSLLEDDGIETSAVAATANAGLTDVIGADPDLVLIGEVHDMQIATAVHAVRRRARNAGIVALTGEAGTADLLALLDAGANAVVRRDASTLELHEAVDHARRRRHYVAPEFVAQALERAPARTGRARAELTPQERCVLRHLAAGRSNREIAEHLSIGTETVKSHLANIYAKLHVHRRQQAVHLAIRHRLV